MYQMLGVQPVVLIGFLWFVAVTSMMVIGNHGHRLWFRGWEYLFKITRNIRAHGTAISTIGTICIVGYAYFFGDFEAIVVVTLFYATALFFTNFLQSERPFPVVGFDNTYFADGHGSETEQGFQYELGLRNNGTADLIDPAVEYRLFDSQFNPVTDELNDGWTQHSDTYETDLTLEPGEHKRFEIEYSPVEHDGTIDYYLGIKVTPRTQYPEVTLLYTQEIKAEA